MRSWVVKLGSEEARGVNFEGAAVAKPIRAVAVAMMVLECILKVA